MNANAKLKQECCEDFIFARNAEVVLMSRIPNQPGSEDSAKASSDIPTFPTQALDLVYVLS